MSELDPKLREVFESGPVLIISKTNAESTVHRRARMDYIGVKKLDKAGRAVGEHRFVGLFTSRAYAEDAEEIPILRDKLRQILESAGVVAGSHDYKEYITIFDSMPRTMSGSRYGTMPSSGAFRRWWSSRAIATRPR
jgi:glutamate dehydrogenase